MDAVPYQHGHTGQRDACSRITDRRCQRLPGGSYNAASPGDGDVDAQCDPDNWIRCAACPAFSLAWCSQSNANCAACLADRHAPGDRNAYLQPNSNPDGDLCAAANRYAYSNPHAVFDTDAQSYPHANGDTHITTFAAMGQLAAASQQPGDRETGGG